MPPNKGIQQFKRLIARLERLIEFARRLLVAIGLIIIFGYCIVLVATKMFEKKVVIHPFTVNDTLEQKGYSSTVVLHKLMAALNTIQGNGNGYFNRSFPAMEIGYHTEIELPDEGLSQYIQFALQKLDRNTHVQGDIVADIAVSVNVVMAGKVLKVNASDIETAIQEAAIAVLKEIDPIRLAAYLSTVRDNHLKEVALQLLNDSDKSNDAYGRHYLGIVYLYANKREQARNQFRAAIELMKDKNFTVPSYNNVGVTFFEEQRFDSAIQYYKKALRIDSSYYKTFLNLSNIKSGQPDSAILLLETANRIKPKDPEILALLANAKLAAKDTVTAKQLIEAALEKRPASPLALVHAILIDAQLGLLNAQEFQMRMEELNAADYTKDKFFYNKLDTFLKDASSNI